MGDIPHNAGPLVLLLPKLPVWNGAGRFLKSLAGKRERSYTMPDFQDHVSWKMKANLCMVLAALSCPSLWDPMDCSLPGSSVQGILQARISEEVAIPFSRGVSWPRDQIQVSWIAGRHFYPSEPLGKPLRKWQYPTGWPIWLKLNVHVCELTRLQRSWRWPWAVLSAIRASASSQETQSRVSPKDHCFPKEKGGSPQILGNTFLKFT